MVERYCGMRSWTHIIAGLGMIMQVEVNYLNGMLYAGLIILGVLFTLMNGKLIQNHDATVISFMSLLVGVLSLIFLYQK
jgi:hypothetical protein